MGKELSDKIELEYRPGGSYFPDGERDEFVSKIIKPSSETYPEGYNLDHLRESDLSMHKVYIYHFLGSTIIQDVNLFPSLGNPRIKVKIYGGNKNTISDSIKREYSDRLESSK